MAQNKNALIRYKTIDKCLQNSYRQWTLNDLIEACSDALYEYEGKDVNVSKRTVQLDIQLMRSDKLGYNAPIEVYDKKYYRYADENYSITDIPLNESDMNVLSETVEMLKQFKDFSLFSELGGIIQRLEDKIYTEKTDQPGVIHLDKNENLKGLEHLDFLYQAILKKLVLNIEYQSFKAEAPTAVKFHPFILKEFNNRWFLVGKKHDSHAIATFALDRIVSLDYDLSEEHISEPFDGDVYYKNTVGVTVMDEKHVQKVVLRIDSSNAPYVLTKPLHHSQKLVKRLENGGAIVQLKVHNNFELERLILGFGETMQVLQPKFLRRRIKDKLNNAIDVYNSDLTDSDISVANKKLEKNGSAILNNVFTKKEIRQIGRILHQHFEQNDAPTFAQRQLLKEIPSLQPLVMNENIQNIVRKVDKNAFLTKAIFFDKPQDKNWFVSWHQDVPINVKEKIEVDGYTSWTKKNGIISVCPPEEIIKNTFTIRIHLDETNERNGALQVVPGSHTKRFSLEEQNTITGNCSPVICEVNEGGIHLMRPLLLHSSMKATNQKRRRVIHLEFSSSELDGGLEWGER